MHAWSRPLKSLGFALAGRPKIGPIMREVRWRRLIRSHSRSELVLPDAGNYQVPPINDLTLVIALNARDEEFRGRGRDTIAKAISRSVSISFAERRDSASLVN